MGINSCHLLLGCLRHDVLCGGGSGGVGLGRKASVLGDVVAVVAVVRATTGAAPGLWDCVSVVAIVCVSKCWWTVRLVFERVQYV